MYCIYVLYVLYVCTACTVWYVMHVLYVPHVLHVLHVLHKCDSYTHYIQMYCRYLIPRVVAGQIGQYPQHIREGQYVVGGEKINQSSQKLIEVVHSVGNVGQVAERNEYVLDQS